MSHNLEQHLEFRGTKEVTWNGAVLKCKIYSVVCIQSVISLFHNQIFLFKLLLKQEKDHTCEIMLSQQCPTHCLNLFRFKSLLRDRGFNEQFLTEYWVQKIKVSWFRRTTNSWQKSNNKRKILVRVLVEWNRIWVTTYFSLCSSRSSSWCKWCTIKKEFTGFDFKANIQWASCMYFLR